MSNDEFIAKCSVVFSKLIEIGRFLRDNGHYKESISCFEALSVGDPSFETGDYAYEIGLNYEKMGMYEDAKRFFQIAVNENPAVADFRNAARRLGAQVPPDPAGLIE